MTRKDFQLIAATIAALPEHPTKAEVAKAFARALAGTNGNFNELRFLDACTPETSAANLKKLRKLQREAKPFGQALADRLDGAANGEG